jgi:hypothetical protein
MKKLVALQYLESSSLNQKNDTGLLGLKTAARPRTAGSKTGETTFFMQQNPFRSHRLVMQVEEVGGYFTPEGSFIVGRRSSQVDLAEQGLLVTTQSVVCYSPIPPSPKESPQASPLMKGGGSSFSAKLSYETLFGLPEYLQGLTFDGSFNPGQSLFAAALVQQPI